MIKISIAIAFFAGMYVIMHRCHHHPVVVFSLANAISSPLPPILLRYVSYIHKLT